MKILFSNNNSIFKTATNNWRTCPLKKNSSTIRNNRATHKTHSQHQSSNCLQIYKK